MSIPDELSKEADGAAVSIFSVSVAVLRHHARIGIGPLQRQRIAGRVVGTRPSAIVGRQRRRGQGVARDEHERLARALQEHLTDQERDVLLMRYYQNLKLTDIAEQTGLSLSTVKRTINQALATLRRKMGAAVLPFGLADVLARAVEVRMLPDVEGATSPGERAAQWGTRAVGAVALAAALGAVAVALQPIEPPEEVLPADPIPTAEAPADTTPPTVAAQEIQNGLVVLTIADDVSGVADAWCIDANDTVHHPLDATGADTLRTYRFQLPSGTHELHVADAAGNTIHGPLEVLVYPEE